MSIMLASFLVPLSSFLSHPTNYSLQADEPTASRCETVLNTTMAEMDVYHEQKIEDMRTVVGDYLDGEIILYEQVCVFFF